jgi:hypothetical protein
MKTLTLLAAAAIMSVATLTSMAPAQQGATVIEHSFIQPFPHTVVHPCTGEIIEMEGNVHVTMHGVITPNGNATTTIHQNFQGISGVSDQGNTYQCVSAIQQTTNTAVGETFTFQGNQSLVGHGNDAVNWLFYLVQHYTINANGTYSVDNLTISGTCGS